MGSFLVKKTTASRLRSGWVAERREREREPNVLKGKEVLPVTTNKLGVEILPREVKRWGIDWQKKRGKKLANHIEA